MTFHRVDQDGDQGLQALATDPIGCLPEHHEDFADRIAVAPRPRTAGIDGRMGRAGQYADRVLSVVPGERDELVEDLSFRLVRACPVSIAKDSNPFLTCLHPELPPHRVAPAGRAGG
jgi:hypothetical protein